MSDLLKQAFSDYVQAAAPDHPSLAPLRYYTGWQPSHGRHYHHDDPDDPAAGSGGLPRAAFALPGVFFVVTRARSLHANTTVCHCRLALRLETATDAEDEATHLERENALRAILEPHAEVSAAISAAPGAAVRVYGYAPRKVTRRLKDRRLITALQWEVGYQPLQPA